MSENVRYGYYLRPSPEMCAAQVRMHQLLERQYGLRVAGKFMPHATIKGFFKSSAQVDEICAAAATISEGMTSFPVWNNGVIGFGNLGIVNWIMRDAAGERNLALAALHERALEALLPLVDSDCNFSPYEWRLDKFEAHLTLAMTDIQPQFFAEILHFCQALAPVGPEMFLAERLHLYCFESDAWHGQWSKTLTWRLLDSWELSSPG